MKGAASGRDVLFIIFLRVAFIYRLFCFNLQFYAGCIKLYETYIGTMSTKH